MITDLEFEEAEARGKEFLKSPRAISARYSRKTGRVTIELVNGCRYSFPVDLVQDLKNASHKDLAQVAVDGIGFTLHWPNLDVDLYVPALLVGVFNKRS